MTQDIKFIKENLFNPHEGLWAETKLNTQFRKDSQKWRGVIGTGFVGLLFKHIWDMFKVSQVIHQSNDSLNFFTKFRKFLVFFL